MDPAPSVRLVLFHIIILCQIDTTLRIIESIITQDNLDLVIGIIIRFSVSATEFLDIHIECNRKHLFTTLKNSDSAQKKSFQAYP